tara:strand:+ start:11702 stop:12064 length:363 start_codon:yes stop_codon:yes gene_type:complete
MKLPDLPKEILDLIAASLPFNNRCRLANTTRELKRTIALRTVDGNQLRKGKKYYAKNNKWWKYGTLMNCSSNECQLRITHNVDPNGRSYINNPVREIRANIKNVYGNRTRPYNLREPRKP